MKLYIFLITMFLSNYVNATAWQSVKFTQDQLKLLEIAKNEGNKIGYPETIQAILVKESTAGLIGPVGDIGNGFGKRSYCHMQIKVAAALHVIERYDLPRFRTEEELIVKLLTDDEFCLSIGAKYFKLMVELTGDWKTAVLAYNRGPTGAKRYIEESIETSYVNDINKLIVNAIRPHERKLKEANNNKYERAVAQIDPECSPKLELFAFNF